MARAANPGLFHCNAEPEYAVKKEEEDNGRGELENQDMIDITEDSTSEDNCSQDDQDDDE